MRSFEREPRESVQAWRAFQLYRDLGERRSVDRAYRLYAGHEEGTKRAPGRWKKWAVQHDWVARAQAWDDYHEMVRRDAVAQYERDNGTNSAHRSLQVQEELLDVKERLVAKMKVMANWPLERRKVEVEKDEEGNEIAEITHIYPARWSFHTLVKAIEVLDDSPDKIAFTDPSGTSEYGQNPEDVRKLFLEILEAEWQDDGEGEGHQ